MKNLSGENRQKAAEMLQEGIKPKEVATKFGVSVAVIYVLKSEMKKAGQIKNAKVPARSTSASTAAGWSIGEFQQAADKEWQRIQDELTRLLTLRDRYMKEPAKHGDFIDAIEKKIGAEQQLSDALRPFVVVVKEVV